MSGLGTTPACELLVVDRKAWVTGNIQTMSKLFEGVEVTGAEAKVVAWEGGALVGLLARAVLAQFDPFRNQLLVVHPNLGQMAHGDGLRYLLFHEVTHLAQFRAAPWIPDHIVELGRSVLAPQDKGWGRQVLAQLPQRLPDIVRWLRGALEGQGGDPPILDMLPEAQREAIRRLHALVTLLEGHATHITEVIARAVLPDYDRLQRHLEARRQRRPLMRLLEAVAGLEMKRQQYVLGRSFCEEVWEVGGAAALAPAWRDSGSVPTLDELRRPRTWLDRVA